MAVDASGNLYIVDSGYRSFTKGQFTGANVRKVEKNGIIRKVAGNGVYGYSGDGGPAINAQLAWPRGIAADASGNVYIADTQNVRVRKVDPSGTISTIAGGGTSGRGDGGPATKAELMAPEGLALDAFGNLYIADSGRVIMATAQFSGVGIRKVDTSGTITTVMGDDDFGLAVSRVPNGPAGLAVDPFGNVYINEYETSRVLRVSAAGTVTTIAGNSTAGYSGDGGPATTAQLDSPGGVAIDSIGRVYIADSQNNAIRLLRASVPSGPAPAFSAAGVISAASFASGGVAPGEIVAIFGGNLGPATGVANSGYDARTGRLPTSLGGVSVSFDGQAAPLYYAGSGQINVQVPYEVSGNSTSSVVVTYDGVASAAVNAPVVASHPGVFGYGGRAIITNALTGALINASNPISRNGYVTIWATGPGTVSPTIPTGGPAPSSPLSWAANPQAWIGGSAVEVQFAGMTPGLAGLLQINLQIPAGAPTGTDVPLKLSINGVLAQAYLGGAPTSNLTIAIQ